MNIGVINRVSSHPDSYFSSKEKKKWIKFYCHDGRREDCRNPNVVDKVDFQRRANAREEEALKGV